MLIDYSRLIVHHKWVICNVHLCTLQRTQKIQDNNKLMWQVLVNYSHEQESIDMSEFCIMTAKIVSRRTSFHQSALFSTFLVGCWYVSACVCGTPLLNLLKHSSIHQDDFKMKTFIWSPWSWMDGWSHRRSYYKMLKCQLKKVITGASESIWVLFLLPDKVRSV